MVRVRVTVAPQALCDSFLVGIPTEANPDPDPDPNPNQALCDSFLVGIPTEEQRKNLHDCMCTALELDADQIKKDSDELKAEAAGKSEADFLAMPELKVSPTCLLY